MAHSLRTASESSEEWFAPMHQCVPDGPLGITVSFGRCAGVVRSDGGQPTSAVASAGVGTHSFQLAKMTFSCFGVAPVAQPMTFPIVGIASGSGAGAGDSGSCPPLCRARETKSVQSLEKRFVDLGSLSCLFAQDATPARLTPLEGTLSLLVG